MRKMIALRDLSHGRAYVRKDDKFSVTDLDAEYYLSRGIATEEKVEEPVRSGRTTRYQTRQMTAAPVPVEPPVAPVVDAPTPDTPAE